MKHASVHSLLPTFVPRSTSYEGRFGRLFGKLPPWVPPGHTDAERLQNIRDFAAEHMFLPEGTEPPMHPDLAAGYTYFGQFIDHDITFDPASSLTRQNDPEGLSNFRSPRLDLDSIYGRGRTTSPISTSRRVPMAASASSSPGLEPTAWNRTLPAFRNPPAKPSP